MRPSIILAAVTVCFFTGQATAQPPAIRVLASNGIRAVMEDLRPQCERAVGRPLSIEFDSSAAFKQKIDKGEVFDVAILTTGLMDDVVKEGKIVKGSSFGIARSGIGVGIKAGAPKPDIRTSAALKQTLLKAKSITFAEDGASRVFIVKMLENFGFLDTLKPKIILEQGSTRAAARVAGGTAEIILTLVSEILPAPGVELVGPLPADVQNYVSMSAGIGSKAHDMEAARALIKFLTSPEIAPTLKNKGMEPVH